jgi:PDZ-binding kinase
VNKYNFKPIQHIKMSFQTPRKPLINKNLDNAIFQTPLRLPSSPLLEKLGCGTGVEVMRFKRSPKTENSSSPWAIKRITKNQLTNVNSEIYGKRLKEEAQILKKLVHPNIVGFRKYTQLSDGRVCLAMEDCSKSLGDILEDRYTNNDGPLPVGQTLKVCKHFVSLSPI